MTQPELRSCWYRVVHDGKAEDRVGMFHEWGMESPAENTPCSIGIVEDCETHAVVTVPPEFIKFIS